MRVNESLLRALIREELGRIDEAVKDTYGYTVRSADDVKWSPDKRRIPKDRNPFVGSSPAYHSWYNDGNQSVRWSKEIEPPGGDPYLLRGSTAIYFNEGNYVIIPSIDASIPGRIMAIYHKDAASMGVPGADETDTIPLANISWSEFGGQGPSTDVGLAFLVKVGTKDPMGSASAAMGYYRAGQDAQAEREEKRAEREARREEKRLAAMPSMPPPVAAPAGPPRTIRRPGGVAAPPPPPSPKTTEMTPAELARWKADIGLRRRE
jgi:hypothetical protein